MPMPRKYVDDAAKMRAYRLRKKGIVTPIAQAASVTPVATPPDLTKRPSFAAAKRAAKFYTGMVQELAALKEMQPSRSDHYARLLTLHGTEEEGDRRYPWTVPFKGYHLPPTQKEFEAQYDAAMNDFDALMAAPKVTTTPKRYGRCTCPCGKWKPLRATVCDYCKNPWLRSKSDPLYRPMPTVTPEQPRIARTKTHIAVPEGDGTQCMAGLPMCGVPSDVFAADGEEATCKRCLSLKPLYDPHHPRNEAPIVTTPPVLNDRKVAKAQWKAQLDKWCREGEETK